MLYIRGMYKTLSNNYDEKRFGRVLDTTQFMFNDEVYFQKLAP